MKPKVDERVPVPRPHKFTLQIAFKFYFSRNSTAFASTINEGSFPHFDKDFYWHFFTTRMPTKQ